MIVVNSPTKPIGLFVPGKHEGNIYFVFTKLLALVSDDMAEKEFESKGFEAWSEGFVIHKKGIIWFKRSS